MVAVVLSGVIGRFIYIQIPRTIQGRELSLGEIKEMKDTMSRSLSAVSYTHLDVYKRQRYHQKKLKPAFSELT